MFRDFTTTKAKMSENQKNQDKEESIRCNDYWLYTTKI